MTENEITELWEHGSAVQYYAPYEMWGPGDDTVVYYAFYQLVALSEGLYRG